jgi:CDP-paratose 2-epimerase
MMTIHPARCGFSEWFAVGEHERAERIVDDLRSSGITSLRVTLSANDYYAPGAEQWHDWLLARVAADLELVPCLRYPLEHELPLDASGALREVRAYTEFVDAVLTRHGKHFTHVELCSPPTVHGGGVGPADTWLLSAEILTATLQAARGGWNIVLGTSAPPPTTRAAAGGVSPRNGAAAASDFYWVHALGQRGLLDEVFALSLQGLYRDKAWEHWDAQARALRRVLDEYGSRCAIWLTEGGFSAGAREEARQVEHYVQFLQVPAERHYWCAWEDRPDASDSSGAMRADGQPKLLARLLRQDAPTRISCLDSWVASPFDTTQRPLAIVGGAGFIGSNLARSFLEDGHSVLIVDNLSRPGVEQNLSWLKATYGERVRPILTDIREEPRLGALLGEARAVVHMAAQVAVTTSLEDPMADFEVNAWGTLRLLEALRLTPRRIPLLFASTNKVYGDLADIPLEGTPDGYLPRSPELRQRGIAETRPLEFCTPYGCSKGVADQYVLDYARSFGVPTAVLRMSCIYGPRQFGTEDQGWVAHFLLQALRRAPITLYGDGQQVRDVLHVDDAVRAYRMVLDAIDEVQGQAFNLGGGADNAVSLRVVLDAIGALLGRNVAVQRGEPRQGDQLYFVADTNKLRRTLGWQARIGWREGLEDLRSWLETLQDQEAPVTQSDPPLRSVMA